MKIRIKKTGEVLEDVKCIDTTLSTITIQYLDDGILRETRIKNLSDIEEICEEPNKYWLINWYGEIDEEMDNGFDVDNSCKEIGNYFKSEEEAKRALEKLKAVKRLKDKGFRFDGYDIADRVGGDAIICGQVYFKAGNYDKEEIENDLYLLFGGEE